MANSFSKEERTAFLDIVDGFEDALGISLNTSHYGTNGEMMERANDIVQRPYPYILNSQQRTIGSAVTSQDATQLQVPTKLTEQDNVTWTMNALELRDALQENRLGEAAYQRLASDIDTKTRNVISAEGTLVVDIAGASGSYDDIAAMEALMDEQGVPKPMRCGGITSRDAIGLSSFLVGTGRTLNNDKSLSALEKSSLGRFADFDLYKIDSGYRVGAAGGSATVDTTGAIVEYAPAANTDNRTQQITVSATAGMAVGDAFTIAGIFGLHHIKKEATNELKTFRVASVDSGTLVTISPPIIGAGGGTDAELQYQNVSVDSTSATAAITFLNQNATGANPFWTKDSVEIVMGRYAVPDNQGVDILRGTTKQGMEVVMGKKFDNSTFETLYTLDTYYGVTNLNPEKNGIIIWNQ